MDELTIERQLARYGEAAERAALDGPTSGHGAIAGLEDAGWGTAFDLERGGSSTRTGRRRRRLGLAVAAAFLMLVGATALVSTLADEPSRVATDPDEPPAPPGAASSYQHPILGWKVEVPSGWHVREFEESCWYGFAVLNRPRDLGPTRIGTCSTDLARWGSDADAVAVIVYGAVRGGPPLDYRWEDTVYPIEAPLTANRWSTRIVAAGQPTGIVVSRWLGTEASTEDARMAAAVIASARPPAPDGGGPSADAPVDPTGAPEPVDDLEVLLEVAESLR